MFGLLNVNKPPGLTSRDVVNRVERCVRGAKTGHAGTLDPLATGVLVICVGPATRLTAYLQRMEKTYRGTFLLGRRSDTDDVDGEMETLTDAPVPSRTAIEDVLPRFRGAIEQVPPPFSAVKVAGRRAYQLARKGRPPRLAPRPVRVHRLEIAAYDYPRLELDIQCSAGTYVRALGRDIAAAVATGAVLSALQRTAVGPFQIANSIELQDVTSQTVAELLLPARMAVPDLPCVALTEREVLLIGRGGTIADRFEHAARHVAAVDRRDRLVAILTQRGQGRLGPLKNFVC